jgi:hypothetical protein
MPGNEVTLGLLSRDDSTGKLSSPPVYGFESLIKICRCFLSIVYANVPKIL